MSRTHPQRRGFALFIIAALGLAIPLGLLFSCSHPPTPETTDLPDIELEENEVTRYSEDGRPIWLLYARKVEYFEELQQTRAENVAVRFLDREGADALIVQADRLIFYHRSGDLQFSGNLQARDPEGLQFSTEEAHWDEETRVLRSSSAVRVEREDLLLTGQGFAYRPDEGTLIIQAAHLKIFLNEQ
jgi:LPS export ABC transporter protein LptC